jgi:hypothetical protein
MTASAGIFAKSLTGSGWDLLITIPRVEFRPKGHAFLEVA